MSTNSVVEQWWNLLDDHSKKIFMKHFHRIWLNKRVPIPANNAKILLEMAKKNQLEMLSGLRSIHYDTEKKQYVVSTQSGGKKYYDWIINATGPSRDVEPNDKFLQQLIENKLARKNPYGGLDVDFETSALINENGCANPFIRVLGHNTAGTYYFVSSVEMIAQKAVKIAKHLAHSMQSTPVMELAA